MRFVAVLLVLCTGASLCAQIAGPPVNAAMPGATSAPFPIDQPVTIAPDGSLVAMLGSEPGDDVVIVELDARGEPLLPAISVDFPAGNTVDPLSSGLAVSRTGRFLCCYGAAPDGDLVLIAPDASGNWTATNLPYPGSGFTTPHGEPPVIAPDETWIACRGPGGAADLVIFPVDDSSGVLVAGTPFGVDFPGGADAAFTSGAPAVTRDSRALAIHGSTPAADLVVVTVGRPVEAASTVALAVDFPAGNFPLDPSQPPAISPTSSFIATHGATAAGDLVIVPLDATRAPQPALNVDWPAGNFTASTFSPPVIALDGRIVAVNGTDGVSGDLLLLPVDPAGTPGIPLAVAFPQGNAAANLQLPPVVARDSSMVLQRGLGALGDLVVTRVSFTSTTEVTATIENVLFPLGNDAATNLSGIALARDASFCAILTTPSIADMVVVPFDVDGDTLAPISVAYPAGNNALSLDATPAISPDGNLIATNGLQAAGEAVITVLDVDPIFGGRAVTSVENVDYAGGTGNLPPGRSPQFSPSGQFLASAGHLANADFVIVPLLNPTAHVLPRPSLAGELPDRFRVRFQAPGDGGLVYAAAATFGFLPGTNLPDGRFLPLNTDFLFFFSILPNPVFGAFTGVLDADGLAEGTIDLRGLGVDPAQLAFYLEFVTLDTSAASPIVTIARPSIF